VFSSTAADDQNSHAWKGLGISLTSTVKCA
jgi:hypothetical protein